MVDLSGEVEGVMAITPSQDTRELMDMLYKVIPDFYLPKHLVALDALPTDADDLRADVLRALKEQQLTHATHPPGYVPYRSDPSEDLLQLILSFARNAPSLRRSSVGPDTALPGAGLDSLAAIDLVEQLREATGAPLPITLVFEYQTPREMAQAVFHLVPDGIHLPGGTAVKLTATQDQGSWHRTTASSPPQELPDISQANGTPLKCLMLHGMAANASLMETFLRGAGWLDGLKRHVEFICIDAPHPSDPKPRFYQQLSDAGRYGADSYFDWGLRAVHPEERLELTRASILYVQEQLAKHAPVHALGGICDGSLIAAVVAASSPALQLYLNVCGTPWAILPDSLQVGSITASSLHLIGSEDEILSRAELMDLPSRCEGVTTICRHRGGHVVPPFIGAVASKARANFHVEHAWEDPEAGGQEAEEAEYDSMDIDQETYDSMTLFQNGMVKSSKADVITHHVYFFASCAVTTLHAGFPKLLFALHAPFHSSSLSYIFMSTLVSSSVPIFLILFGHREYKSSRAQARPLLSMVPETASLLITIWMLMFSGLAQAAINIYIRQLAGDSETGIAHFKKLHSLSIGRLLSPLWFLVALLFLRPLTRLGCVVNRGWFTCLALGCHFVTCTGALPWPFLRESGFTVGGELAHHLRGSLHPATYSLLTTLLPTPGMQGVSRGFHSWWIVMVGSLLPKSFPASLPGEGVVKHATAWRVRVLWMLPLPLLMFGISSQSTREQVGQALGKMATRQVYAYCSESSSIRHQTYSRMERNQHGVDKLTRARLEPCISLTRGDIVTAASLDALSCAMMFICAVSLTAWMPRHETTFSIAGRSVVLLFFFHEYALAYADVSLAELVRSLTVFSHPDLGPLWGFLVICGFQWLLLNGMTTVFTAVTKCCSTVARPISHAIPASCWQWLHGTQTAIEKKTYSLWCAVEDHVNRVVSSSYSYTWVSRAIKQTTYYIRSTQLHIWSSRGSSEFEGKKPLLEGDLTADVAHGSAASVGTSGNKAAPRKPGGRKISLWQNWQFVGRLALAAVVLALVLRCFRSPPVYVTQSQASEGVERYVISSHTCCRLGSPAPLLLRGNWTNTFWCCPRTCNKAACVARARGNATSACLAEKPECCPLRQKPVRMCKSSADTGCKFDYNKKCWKHASQNGSQSPPAQGSKPSSPQHSGSQSPPAQGSKPSSPQHSGSQSPPAQGSKPSSPQHSGSQSPPAQGSKPSSPQHSGSQSPPAQGSKPSRPQHSGSQSPPAQGSKPSRPQHSGSQSPPAQGSKPSRPQHSGSLSPPGGRESPYEIDISVGCAHGVLNTKGRATEHPLLAGGSGTLSDINYPRQLQWCCPAECPRCGGNRTHPCGRAVLLNGQSSRGSCCPFSGVEAKKEMEHLCATTKHTGCAVLAPLRRQSGSLLLRSQPSGSQSLASQSSQLSASAEVSLTTGVDNQKQKVGEKQPTAKARRAKGGSDPQRNSTMLQHHRVGVGGARTNKRAADEVGRVRQDSELVCAHGVLSSSKRAAERKLAEGGVQTVQLRWCCPTECPRCGGNKTNPCWGIALPNGVPSAGACCPFARVEARREMEHLCGADSDTACAVFAPRLPLS